MIGHGWKATLLLRCWHRIYSLIDIEEDLSLGKLTFEVTNEKILFNYKVYF